MHLLLAPCIALLLVQGTFCLSCNDSHTSAALVSASKSACQPQPTVVALKFPQENLQVQRIYPSHVTVNRCAGSCAGLRSMRCYSAGTRTLDLPVLVATCAPGARCKEFCTHAQVEEHLSCLCGCLLDHELCGDKQVFVEEDCSCGCSKASSDLKAACLENPLKEWRNEECECQCKSEHFQTCGEGRGYDFKDTCSCMPLAEVGDPLQGFGEESGEDATLDTLLISWELVVVMILSILIFLLCTALVMTLKRLSLVNKSRNFFPHSHLGSSATWSNSDD